MTDDTRARVLITPARLHALIESPATLTILVIQSANPYSGKSLVTATRIPGAIDAQAYTDFAAAPTATSGQRPLPAIADLQAAARRWGLHRESTVVVYDNDRSMTAARAWWVLRWAGLPDVRVLDGGFPAWQAAGLPEATDAGPPTPSEITLSPGHMPEIGAEETAAMAREAVVLDARIRPNYIGRRVAPGQPGRGHIPGARCAPALDNVTDYGSFTDNEVLRELYAALGADGSKPVGVYCGAGMSAAHTVLALAAIGINAAMYPGSWSAWVTDPSRPVTIGASPG